MKPTLPGLSRTFIAVSLAAVAFRVFLVAALPYGQSIRFGLEGLNDEPAHYNYVKYLAYHRAFPVQTMSTADPDAFTKAEFEYYQPPLYYLLAAPLTIAFGESVGFYGARMLSLLFGLGTIVYVARILREAGASPAARRSGVLFSLLLPVQAYFSSLVSNDSLSWFIAAWLTYELLRCLPRGSGGQVLTWRRTALITLLVAAGMLTKTSLAVFYPAAALVFAAAAVKLPARNSWLVRGLTVIAVSALLALPWYLRNVSLYGSITALHVGFGPPTHWMRSGRDAAAFLWGLAGCFWFPMQHLTPGITATALRATGGLLLLGHAALAGWYALRVRENRFASSATVFLAAVLTFTLLAFVRLNLLWWDSEGRYLYAAFAPIVFFMTVPVCGLLDKSGKERLAPLYLGVLAFHPYLYILLGATRR